MVSPAAIALNAGSDVGFVGKIPIRNVWLLMLYASDLYQLLGSKAVGVEENPDELPELVAEILTREVQRRLQRNLTAGYRERHQIMNRVRGRIDHLYTHRHQLLSRGQVACRFEELTVDTLRNRFVRAALERLARIVRRQDLKHRCRSLAESLRMMGVKGSAPSRSEVGADRFGRHDAGDRTMVAAAWLAFDLALPTEEAGQKHLTSPDRDEVWARRLFERAVGGFCQAVLTPDGWSVRTGRKLNWQLDWVSEGMSDVLPGMTTDIILDHPAQDRRIVIDTKFTSLFKLGRFGSASISSTYLYQIYAYLKSQTGRGGLNDVAEGLMLHPSVGEAIDVSASIQGQKVRFATIDLSADSVNIREQLRSALVSQ